MTVPKGNEPYFVLDGFTVYEFVVLRVTDYLCTTETRFNFQTEPFPLVVSTHSFRIRWIR